MLEEKRLYHVYIYIYTCSMFFTLKKTFVSFSIYFSVTFIFSVIV